MAGPFLTARWRHICLVTYAVDTSLLAPYLPRGVSFERHEGNALMSLVGFEFEALRVRGIPVPGAQRFAELNLRFYVHRGDQRGVVFVKEFAPSRLVCAGARTLFSEPYERAETRSMVHHEGGRVSVNMLVRTGTQHHNIRVVGRRPSFTPGETTLEHRLKERAWGFGRSRRGRTYQYKVEHPLWSCYPVHTSSVEIDWVRLYGARFRVMHDARPMNVMLVEGSDVALFGREIVR